MFSRNSLLSGSFLGLFKRMYEKKLIKEHLILKDAAR